VGAKHPGEVLTVEVPAAFIQGHDMAGGPASSELVEHLPCLSRGVLVPQLDHVELREMAQTLAIVVRQAREVTVPELAHGDDADHDHLRIDHSGPLVPGQGRDGESHLPSRASVAVMVPENTA